MAKSININGRNIGENYEPYVIAEISGNHNGDIERAIALIDAAKESGANAVKLQTYTADTITIDHNGPDFQITEGLWRGRTLYDLYKEASTPWDWHPKLFERGRQLGITIFSSPFDSSAVEFLLGLGAPAYKIASFEMIDFPLVKLAAETGKPVIISTGMASLEEISELVEIITDVGCVEFALLHCVSGYPTPSKESNLRTLKELSSRFDTVIGLSDHTLGTASAVASVALGATIIEKHFTLKRSDGGPDAAFSLEPEEFKNLCKDVKTAWESLGTAGFDKKPSEQNNTIFRRSLYVVEAMAAGDAFTSKNVRSIRPGFGLPPKHYPDILGKKARRSITSGTPLDWSLIN